MKKRVFVASLVASFIVSAISIFTNLNFWLPVVLSSYGELITGAGMLAFQSVIYLAIFLPLYHFLSKNHKGE